MADGFIHTVHKNGNWLNEVEGARGEIPGRHRTKRAAVTAGRARARRGKTEHVIHKLNGEVGERRSYGRPV